MVLYLQLLITHGKQYWFSIFSRAISLLLEGIELVDLDEIRQVTV